MLKLCNIDLGRSQEIFTEINDFIRKLRIHYKIEKVYLFGSFAKDEIHEGSDIDLIIVGDFKGKMFARIMEVLKLTDLPIEPLIYTKEEFKRLKRTSTLIKDILKTARPL